MLDKRQGAPPLEARFRLNSPQAGAQIIEGEAIMVNLVTGSYYSLIDIGVEIWAGIETRTPLGEIIETISLRYQAPGHEVEPVVLALISRLLEEGLIVAAQTEPGPAQEPFSMRLKEFPVHASGLRPPVLEKYDDMADLIQLDPIHEVGEDGWPQSKMEPDAG